MTPLRYHAPLAGCGGRVKVHPEDFVVEEVPEGEPSGSGDHLWLWVEKRDLDSEGLVAHLVRALGIDPVDVGAAGRKDARAVTRQVITVPARSAPRLEAVESPQVTVLAVHRHDQKLRTGRLRANRFEVLVRDGDPQAAAAVAARLERLGMPNFFGAQRFGRGGVTAEVGFGVLRGARLGRGDPPPKLAVSAAQAMLFNRYLARRISDGSFDRLLLGDVVLDHRTGVTQWALEPEALQGRYERGEVVPLGPMFGPKMRRARGEAAAHEERVLRDAQLDLEAFERLGRWAPGTRRPIRVWPTELSSRAEPAGVRLRFTLPPGAYATVLLGEVMGTEATKVEAG